MSLAWKLVAGSTNILLAFPAAPTQVKSRHRLFQNLLPSSVPFARALANPFATHRLARSGLFGHIKQTHLPTRLSANTYELPEWTCTTYTSEEPRLAGNSSHTAHSKIPFFVLVEERSLSSIHLMELCADNLSNDLYWPQKALYALFNVENRKRREEL
ncbi:hypothetical protein PENSPDRAFT_493616 [Peniophora sp. CONT]|nr:hypothetical protein PENSPDRAFT_493616 [Peniophora sp. CONT]